MRSREPAPPEQNVKIMDHFFRRVRLSAHDRPVSVDSRHYQPPPIRGGPAWPNAYEWTRPPRIPSRSRPRDLTNLLTAYLHFYMIANRGTDHIRLFGHRPRVGFPTAH